MTTRINPDLADRGGLLERLYGSLTPYLNVDDPEYVGLVLDTAYATLTLDEWAVYPETLRWFVTSRQDDLVALLRDYGPGSALGRSGHYELVQSPAVIVACERLTVKPLAFQAEWGERWESETPLEDLRNAWGT